MASKKYDMQRAHDDRDRKLRGLGVQPLICASPGRPKVSRGNRVWNALAKGMVWR